MEFYALAGIKQTNIPETKIAEFNEIKVSLASDTGLDADQLKAAGKVYKELVTLIRNDSVSIADMQIKIQENAKIFMMNHCAVGMNAAVGHKLLGQSISLFAGKQTYAEEYAASKGELAAIEETGLSQIAILTSRIQILAKFAASIVQKAAAVSGLDEIHSGEDTIIIDMLAMSSIERPEGDSYELANADLAPFEAKGACAGLLKSKTATPTSE